MNLLASQSGNPVLGLLLLPVVFAFPLVLTWIEFRAFRKSEAQSLFILILLLIMGCIGGYAVITGGFAEFNRVSGFWKGWMALLFVGLLAFPITVGWELYKRGWLRKWFIPEAKSKKKKKKKRMRLDI
ncbi:MAG: hypothetical protein JNJ77_08880 [Planctomycetia bacterium]|nr:hypothetical protein [Planctomycetia bacterium]